MKNKVVAIVQARMGSVRFPNKVLKSIVNKTMIELLLVRLSSSSELDKIIVATSTDVENNQLQMVVESLGFECFRGSEDNVLNRYYAAANSVSADIVVRITGDCPFIDSGLVDQCIRKFKKLNVDYLSNTDPMTYPDGLDVEVMSFKSLKESNSEACSGFDKEHVTSFIRSANTFSKASLNHSQDLSNRHFRRGGELVSDV